MQLFVFICAGAMILAGAIGVITRSHPVHAALSLILTLFGVAVMYVSLEAPFLAAVQVIVYAGAIVVLFLFVIMLLGVDKAEDLHVEPFKLQRKVAVVVGGGVVGSDRLRSHRVAGQHRPGQTAAERCVDGRRSADERARQQHPGPRPRPVQRSRAGLRAHVGAAGDRSRRHGAAGPPGTEERPGVADMIAASLSRPRRGTSSWPPCCSASARSACWSAATR